MTDVRRFTRLRPGLETPGSGTFAVPVDGMCLSAFLVLRPPRTSGRVLFGRVNPSAPWGELGALDAGRLSAIADQWMLPSSQLLFYEAPDEAARRIAREQLEVELPRVDRFSVHSEAYERRDPTPGERHWDLHFVFEARWPSPRAPRAAAWRELEFLDVRTVPRDRIARGQGDVLELIGLPPAPAAPAMPGSSAPASGSGRTRRP